jgi:DNA-binding response OmpR family regulator
MKNVRILLVDDESLILWTLENVLSQQGYEVCPAASGEEALQCISKKYMDLLIIDMEMPGMNGLEVLSQIKQCYPPKKCIILTAVDSEELIEVAREAGVNDFIFKPFQFNEVTYRVKKVLET